MRDLAGVTPPEEVIVRQRGNETHWCRKAGAGSDLGNENTRRLQERDPSLEPAQDDVPVRRPLFCWRNASIRWLTPKRAASASSLQGSNASR
jgi:hypothetical protein